MEKCKHCGSDNLDLGRAVKQNGDICYPVYCVDCLEVSNHYIKKEVALDYEKTNGKLRDVRTRTSIYNEEDGINIECEVCKKPEAELHHFAPKHLFGKEATKWPTAYLCRQCHQRWHDLVTPNMSNKKG